jgi:hypothetical protein
MRADGLHFRDRSAQLVASWILPLALQGRGQPG